MGLREFSALGRRPVLLAIVLGLISIGLVGTGILGVVTNAHEREQFRALSDGSGIRAEAVLTELVVTQTTQTGGRRHNREPDTCPRYSFSVDGAGYSVLDTSDCSERSDDFSLGATVTVIYDPDDPSVAFVDTPGARQYSGFERVFSITSIVVGAVLAVLAPFLVLRARRRRAR